MNPISRTPGTPVPAPTPSAPPPTGEVEFSYNPQDHVVMAPTTTTVKGVQAGPTTERASISSKLEPKDGKYVYAETDKEFLPALTLGTVAKTVEVLEKAYGSKIPWAFRSEKIKINPDAGKDFNAYYSRQSASVNFFHDTDPKTNKVVYSGGSGEVVSHEAGHALLDGIRPDYLGTWSTDPGGFHEAFGDILAMLMVTQDDKAVEVVAKQTGGDLSKPNSLAQTGEELGAAINHSVGKNVTGGDYVRNAINKFVWQDPKTLPDRGGPDQLGSEVHSWSRLWTGAFYDVMKGMVDQNVKAGMSPSEAIRAAGDENLKLYGLLLKDAPRGEFTYQQMAQTLLKVDEKSNGGKNQELIRKVYTDRKILGPQAAEVNLDSERDPEAPALRTVSVTLDGEGFGMFSGAKVETPVDGASPLYQDVESKNRLKDNVQRMIAQGRILYTEPNQKIEEKDLFDKGGHPYAGVVRWVDGQMTIERVPIVS